PGALEHRPLLDVELEEGTRERGRRDARAAAHAASLLVAERDDRQRRVGALRHLDRRDDAERTVEAAAVRDGVEVRADPQAAVAAAPEEVPGGVRLDLEPRLCEPPRGERVRGVLLGRVAGARGADGVQLVEALEDAA